MSLPRARVVTLNTALGPLDYRVPDGLAVEPGSVVVAPLGPRELIGVVWEADRLPSEQVGDNRLRPLAGLIDVAPVPAPLRRLAEWVADYYLSPLAAVLRMILPSSSALAGPRQLIEYRPTNLVPPRLTPQRQQAIERLAGRQGTIRELADIAEVSDAVLRGLVNAGALEAVAVEADRPLPRPDPDFAPPLLSDDQRVAAATLAAARGFDPILLDGVTGSGKTEVYFEAIADCLRRGRQSLVLLPEIALTEPFLKRFEARFGCAPTAWHSGLRSSQRRRAWRGIASGEAAVTVGARSALFLPYANLGLIVVDEAHEPTFKQEEGVQYHARDVAVMRGKFEEIPVILSSATPALETRHMVEIGRYREVALPSRFAGAQLPEIRAIDLTQDPPPRGRWLAPTLVAGMEANLAAGEQSLLFLNRRGFAPLTLCRHCGHRFQCPNCTAWMVEHRLMHRLACHHCGHVEPPPRACPECGEEDSLVACGPGVERIADEVAALFPDARIAIVTSDTIWSPAKAAEFVRAMEAREIDIVIGTQLVTKGYHFPDLTLVGVVDADLGLQGGDLRAAERSFQQISQVAGRAGRGEKPGRVLVQTHDPDAPVIAALVAGDTPGFIAAETEARREAAMPPFGRLAAIVISAEDAAEAEAVARRIARAAPRVEGMAVFGPAPAPLAMLRGRHRQRLLVHAARSLDVQDVIREWLAPIEWSAKVRVSVDVDPYSFPLTALIGSNPLAVRRRSVRFPAGGVDVTRFILAMLTAVSVVAAGQPAAASWQRASSKHFIIYSDSSPQRLRDFAGRLEKFDKAVRYVRNMSDPAIGDGNRVTLFVVSDQDAVVKLARDKSGTVAGFYAGRVSGSIAVIPKSLDDETRAGAMTSETVFFHEYAHHLMLSDTETPYPEWLIEGFAEFMSTARFERDGSVGLGAPAQFRAYEVLGENPIPLDRLLAGGYYRLGRLDKSSFYGRSWLLTHYLNFTPSRSGQLTAYLDEFARTGDSLGAARHAFGDLKKLEQDLTTYLNKPTMTYVKVRPDLLTTGPVTIEALSPGGEAVIRDRIQSKVGVDRTTAEPLAARVRLVERRFPGDPLVERTLAEAELDSGHPEAALAAAKRALQVDPRDVEAMVYKGRAIEAGTGAGRFAEARSLFIAANKIDTEDPEPLALFYSSYLKEGVRPNANAVEALHYASNLAPQDTGVRMNSAIQYLRDGHLAEGRALLTAVAFDPHGQAAAKVAQAMIEKIDAGDVKAALAAPTSPAAP